MTRWFRMYTDVLDDPKVQKLPPPLFKTWVNLLCLAGRNDGVLPQMEDVAFALRMDEESCNKQINDLILRGLLDQGDGLIPHNWDARQFKSDRDETAAERQRNKRARDKTRDVTRDMSVTSHPPETDTDTEQRESDAREEGDPKHWAEAQTILKDRADDLGDWEIDFLHSIKWKPSLSKAQADSLKGIQDKLGARNAKPYALPTVKRGTPAYDAWIAYYRKRGPTAFYEKLDALTVPSEFPPQERAA